MTALPASVDEDLSLTDALDRMSANNIRHLLVARAGHLVGVVSTRDLSLAAALSGGKASKTPVATAMAEHPYSCDAGDKLEDVARAMEAHRYGCAIVLVQGNVAGIFTTTDALRALRSAIAGHVVEPEVRPTHIVEQPSQRVRIDHHTSAGAALASSHADPNPNLGTIR